MPELIVFEPEEFKEQCFDERELMIEILDVFDEEQGRQVSEMSEALAETDYERLGRVAHTIKGSLGSLHAPSAWASAQALERAAQERNRAAAEDALTALKRELETLKQHLEGFRRESLS